MYKNALKETKIKTKKTLKIIGIIVSIAIVITIVVFLISIVFTLSGIGNPITRAIAKKEITEYVENIYPNNDFGEINIKYNFKFGFYGSQIVSQSSIDTRFYISYNDGKIADSYDDYVQSGLNTHSKLTSEYHDYVAEIIANKYPGEIELCLFDLSSINSKQDSLDIISETVPLDGTLSITELDDIGIEPSLMVWFITDDITYENAADKLIELKELMETNNIFTSTYSVFLRLPEDNEDRFEKDIHVYDFPAALIGTDNLIDLIKEYDEQGKQIVQKE